MLRALFVGVDRHADDEIRELVGASRDATVLWALMSDTVADLAGPSCHKTLGLQLGAEGKWRLRRER